MISVVAADGVIRERLPDEALLVFPSDTHIGGLPGSDIFESAAELTMLVEDLHDHDGPVELVLAGDFLDLLRMEDPGDGDPVAATLARPEYRELFGTLRAFAGADRHRVVYVVGNHDAAVWWNPRIRRTLREAGLVDVVALAEVDVRPVLPLVRAPALILHRRDFGLVPIAHARYLADQITGARLVELPGSDVDLSWETPELGLDAIQEFLTGVRRAVEPNGVLATVLFTDIVASTERAARLGDRRWRQLLEVHDELASRLVDQFQGRLVKTTGDGILATFDGPGRAVRCAAALRDELGGIGCRSGRGCTAARSNCVTATSVASPSTSPPG
jgi:hypothetical protein